MILDTAIFKANDIRGVVETQLTPKVTQAIGHALGSLTLESGRDSLVVGMDGRLTSSMLKDALNKGIMASGCNVIDIGLVTTPMVYFANYELGTMSGVMITGSHNPAEYNGLKMVVDGKTLTSDAIQSLRVRVETASYMQGAGEYHTHDIKEVYIQKILANIHLNRKLKVAVDCGNGVAGDIAPELFRRLGCDVLELYCDVDGNFPNHHPDPSRPENLADLISLLAESDAEIGLAFDGDGDRLGVVTKDGNIIYPDRQMMLYAQDVLLHNPQSKIIFDVKSSRLLAPWIIKHGGEPIMCKTGHSFVKAKIKETGALLAGEMSGHLFFNDRWNGTDDGVYAGCRLLEILSKVDDASQTLNNLPNSISTPEINVPVAEGEQYSIMQNLSQHAKFVNVIEVITVDGLRVEYQDGFGLVRASNTTPVLVLRFEAETIVALERIMAEFRNLLAPLVKNVVF
jgi:phosphomannomutase/phosphoglucomutase